MRTLVHADESRQWEPAAAIAARIARAAGGHVTVLTAERAKGRREEVLRRAEHVVGLPPSQLALRGEPGLVEQVVPRVANAGGFDLLVLGPLGGLDRLTHGHIVGRLVDHTRCTALLVRGSGSGFAKALVATEGPEHGAVNMEAAMGLSAIFDMRVTLLHVLSQIAIYDYLKEQPKGEFLRSDHPAAAHLRTLRDDALRRNVKGEAKVRAGPVQDEVLAEVKDGGYDLLVIGAHAGTREEHFLTRDIAGWLLRHCPVSTLVVRQAWRMGLPAAGGKG